MKEKKRLQKIRMVGALGDFQLALSAATFLSDAEEGAHYSIVELRRFRCFEHTAIISYARPFSQSKGSLPKLSLKQCAANLTTLEQELHDRVITLRNKLVAHSDLEMMNFASFVEGASADPEKGLSMFLARHDEGLQFYSFREQSAFVALITKVQFSLYRRLFNEAQADPTSLRLNVHHPKE